MNTETDIKRQLSQLKGKSEREIMKLMLEWSKNGQADNFTHEDRAKIVEALDYAEKHGLSIKDTINKKMGYR